MAVKTAVQKKKYTCAKCGKRFPKPQSLAGHMHTHGAFGQKQAAAPPVAASQSPSSRQSEEKGAKCPVCGQSFSGPSYMAQHIKFRHPDKNAATVLKTAAVSVPAGLAAQATSAAEAHLRNALESLTGRQRSIEEELSRMAGLESEKNAVANQIKAVEAALQAFGRG